MTERNSHKGRAYQTTILAPSARGVSERWPAGSLLDGRYRVREIRGGAGITGMGVVYVLEDEGRVIAAKTFQHQYTRDLHLIQRFLREAETWLLIDVHPNIVRAYSVDLIDTIPFIFVEYVESDERGRLTLGQRMRSGRLAPEETLDFALQCCEGMAHAVAAVPGLVHRDLKPENLLIAANGTLKITDFGLARSRLAAEIAAPGAEIEAAAGLTAAGAVFGTPDYMAPEQFLDTDKVDTRADIYALGCCLYEALAGRRVFTFDGTLHANYLHEMRERHCNERPAPLQDAAPDCPRPLADVIMRCIEKEPGERFSSFLELREVLKEVQLGAAPVPYRPRPAPELSPREVAEHVWSLELLKGYSEAIKSRPLRESKEVSPYSFHLALASYFHCRGEPREERRQLERAVRARAAHEGHEAVRRLSELLVAAGECEQARTLLDMYLGANPSHEEHVLEGLVALAIAEHAYAEAETLLDKRAPDRRTDALRLRLYRASGQEERLETVLRRVMEESLERLCAAAEAMGPGANPAVDFDGDLDRLREALGVLRPGLDTDVLERCAPAVWPALEGFPDLTADLAWLAESAGGLAELEKRVPADERARLSKCASLLGYPERLARHLRHDECWIWRE